MNKKSVTSRFITELLVSGDMGTVLNEAINSKFLTGTDKRAFEWITQHYNRHGNVPSIYAFKRKFHDYPLERIDGDYGTQENMLYWVDSIRELRKHNTLVEALEKITLALKDDDVAVAEKELKKANLKITNELTKPEHMSLRDIEKRWESYLTLKNTGGLIGYSTGIEELDKMIHGAVKGTLTTIMAYTGLGKANPVSSPVLTPNGFKPMGEIKPNDFIIGQDGKKHRVAMIHPQGVQDIYEVSFSDGTASRCTKEHLWKFKNRHARNKDWQVRTLEDIMKLKLTSGSNNRGYNLVIPVCESVEFAKQHSKLPIDPYVLGVILGDGGITHMSVNVSSNEPDIIDKCNRLIKKDGKFEKTKANNFTFAFKPNSIKEIEKGKRNILKLKLDKLGLFGKKSEFKFIPTQYLMASVPERLELLRGLMDTDGHITAKGSYSFDTTSSELKSNVEFLCRSLGYRTTCMEDKRPYGENGNGVCYRITILTKDVIVSSEKHLKRLSNVQKGNRTEDKKVMAITDIKLVGREECQCITVDSIDKTYLVDSFIVTHNTFLMTLLATFFAKELGLNVLFITIETSKELVMRRVDAIWAKFNYSQFSTGTLTKKEEKAYRALLESMLEAEGNIIVESLVGQGVSAINAKIVEHKPDIVLVDGAYLMADERGEEDNHAGVLRVFNDIHALCLTSNLPFFATTQSKDETGTSMKSLNFAKALATATDNLIAMEQDLQMKHDKELRLKPLKLREGEILKYALLNWDFNQMDFSTIYEESMADALEETTVLISR